MSVSPETAQELIEDLHLVGRVLRGALVSPDYSALHPGGLGVLVALVSKGHCRQNELAADLCISQSALSRHITDLVHAGFADKRPDPGDGRATQIEVTDEGMALLARTRAAMALELQAVLADWTESDARAAHHTIHKLKQSLTRHAHRSAELEHVSHLKGSQEVHV
ncbi:MarR family winged helix-turn-helix transcriptional regulator [Williamsia soli]|uniref:MarR family winged helix-turn-helix transcriptional regulator n=1 Tax=Williamsia soli TaxID=364929 RepID=UPI001A9D94FE|nr:MarR family transcriptional regulator [Williamsia soli]